MNISNKTDSLNLIPAIRAIENQIAAIDAEYRNKVAPYKSSLAHLREINTACEKCGGTGKVFFRACAEDEGDTYVCEVCHGSGMRPRAVAATARE